MGLAKIRIDEIDLWVDCFTGDAYTHTNLERNGFDCHRDVVMFPRK